MGGRLIIVRENRHIIKGVLQMCFLCSIKLEYFPYKQESVMQTSTYEQEKRGYDVLCEAASGRHVSQCHSC